MKINKWLYTYGISLVMGLTVTSCNDYLDEDPDNRTAINTEEKIISLLTSAYSQGSYAIVNEVMSDNTDDMGDRYSKYDDRFVSQAFSWSDITEADNDGLTIWWEYDFKAIAAANQALQSIEELGGANTVKMKEAKGEALLCRAYHYFKLANEFCHSYDAVNSETDLGLPYLTEPETELAPSYSRGTVAELYRNIEKDINEALPLIGDTHYTQPKYHFNKQAAYAFATRFFLFYEKWDRAVECANFCLGTNPKSILRDWDEMNTYGITSDLDPRNNLYISDAAKCNFLIVPTISMAGYFFSNYSYITKYSHNSYISTNETLEATNVWGTSDRNTLRCEALAFKGGAMDRSLVAKTARLFEELNPVSKTGYWHSVLIPFRADITLLERAEAYIMLKQYDKACADLTMWMQNWTKSKMTLTPDAVKNYYSSLAYHTSFAPTQRRHLYPSFAIDNEGSVQECMIQCVLNFKRIETIHEGLRWFDVKRYGINITRRVMNADSEPDHLKDSLVTRDPRRAIQLPFDVTTAGLQANPR